MIIKVKKKRKKYTIRHQNDDYILIQKRYNEELAAKAKRVACNDPDEDVCSPDGYTRKQTWGGLVKARYAYFLNSERFSNADMSRYYAAAIQKLQHELGEKMSAFPELNMTVAGFFADHAEYLQGEYTGDDIEEMMHRDILILNKMREKNTTDIKDVVEQSEYQEYEGGTEYQEYEKTSEYEDIPEFHS